MWATHMPPTSTAFRSEFTPMPPFLYRRLRRLIDVVLGVIDISRCGLHICRRLRRLSDPNSRQCRRFYTAVSDGSLMLFWASPTSRDVGYTYAAAFDGFQIRMQ